MGDVAIPPGVVCTPEQYNRVLRGDATIHCLDRGQSIALTIVTEIGLISAFAVIYVYFIIIRNVVRHLRRKPDSRLNIVQEPMDILMLSLFVADFIQALGAVLDIKWVHSGVVEIGAYCTAQGVIQQLGETGVAMTTLLIAIYTFIGVWWRIGMGQSSVRVAKIITGLVWLFIILMIIIGNATHADKRQLYESPTPYWCWIGNDYLQWRIWGEYVWFWITLAFSFFAYTLLFFWSRGNITLSEDSWWKFTVHRRSKFDSRQNTRMQSLVMLAYPIVYSIIILPLSIVRWIGFEQERGPGVNRIGAPATMAVISIYGLSGLFNVVLLLTTRPNSVLFGRNGSEYACGCEHTSPPTYKMGEIVGTGGRHDMGPSTSELGRLPSRSTVGSTLSV